MLAGHLMCRSAGGDELLSHTKDIVFLLWFLFKRYSEDHKEAKLQFFDRTRLLSAYGTPAAMYPALELCETLNVPEQLLWKHGGQFTHEYISHGPLHLDESSIMRQASAQDLIRDGIGRIWSPLVPKAGHKYPKACQLRRLAFPGEQYTSITAVSMTKQLFKTVRKVALNFVHVPANQQHFQLPSHIFISLLSLQKRFVQCPIFTQWIAKYYKAHDVLDLYVDAQGRILPGITSLTNNLPNYEQYLDLVRDCIAVFSLPRLPENDIQNIPIRYHGKAGHSRKKRICHTFDETNLEDEDVDEDDHSDSDNGAGERFLREGEINMFLGEKELQARGEEDFVL